MATENDVNRRTVLGVTSLGNFAQIGARFVLSPLIPLVVLEFDTSKSSIGLALTGMWGVYALGQFPSGVLADRYGERRLIVTGLVGTAAGSVLISLSPAFPLFGLFAMLLGLATGLFFSPAASLLTRLFTDDGKALGVLTAASGVAGVIYPACSGLIGDTVGWRYAVGASGLVALAVALATVQWLPQSDPGSGSATLFQTARIRGLLTQPAVLYATGLAVVFGFAFQSITSFFPTFLQEYHVMDTGAAGVTFGVLFALSSLAQPVVGSASDVVSRDVALSCTALTTGSGLTALLTIDGLVGVALGTVLLGLGMSWPGVVQAKLMDQLPSDERGSGFGFLRTVYMFFAASGSVVVGTLADAGGWVTGYGAVIALLAAALVAMSGAKVVGSRR